MEQEAIKHIEEGAIAKTLADRLWKYDIAAHLVPPDYRVEPLEEYQQHRVRFRGEYCTNYVEEFAAYVKANGGSRSRCFVDAEAMRATAVIDIGDVQLPGHCDHAATVILKPTAEYGGLKSVLGKQTSQRDIAEWMEDWRDNLKALDQGESAIEIKQAISAARALTIDAKISQEHTTENLRASKSTLESIEAGSKGRALPAYLVFTCAPFDELKPREFRCRVSVLTGGKDPMFVLRLVQDGTHCEEMAQEFKTLVTASLAETDVSIHLGIFKKG